MNLRGTPLSKIRRSTPPPRDFLLQHFSFIPLEYFLPLFASTTVFRNAEAAKFHGFQTLLWRIKGID